MEVLIRPFRPPDWDSLFFLDQSCFVPPYRLEYPRLRGLVQDPTVIVLVVEAQDGDESGLCGGMLVKLQKEEGSLVLIALMIDSGFRRIGLGRRLMGWAHRIARANALDLLLAPLEAGNEGGEAFLAALGFASEPGVPPFFDDPAGGNIWRRAPAELEPPSQPVPGDGQVPIAAEPPAGVDPAVPVMGATPESASDEPLAAAEGREPLAPEEPVSAEPVVQHPEAPVQPAAEAGAVPEAQPAPTAQLNPMAQPSSTAQPAPTVRKPGRIKHTGPKVPGSGHKKR